MTCHFCCKPSFRSLGLGGSVIPGSGTPDKVVAVVRRDIDGKVGEKADKADDREEAVGAEVRGSIVVACANDKRGKRRIKNQDEDL